MRPFDQAGLDIDSVLQAIVIGGEVLGRRQGATKRRRRVPEKQARLVRLLAEKGEASFDELAGAFEREWQAISKRRQGEALRLRKRELFRNIADLIGRINAALLAGYEDEEACQRVLAMTGGAYLRFRFDHQTFTTSWVQVEDLDELRGDLPRPSGAQHARLEAEPVVEEETSEEPPPPVEAAAPAPAGDQPKPAPADTQPEAPQVEDAPRRDPNTSRGSQAPTPSKLEITVSEDPVTGVWAFDLHGYRIEVERAHGLVKIDGAVHEAVAVRGLESVDDLAGEPLAFIGRLIEVLAETRALKEGGGNSDS